MTFLTRPYQDQDYPLLNEIYCAAITAIDDGLYSPAEKSSWINRKNRPFSDLLNQCEFRMVLAPHCPDTVIGYYAIRHDGKKFELLYIHPDYHRRGIAQQAIQEGLSLAKAKGATCIHTDASLASFPIFMRMGFENLGIRYSERDGQRIPYYQLRMTLL